MSNGIKFVLIGGGSFGWTPTLVNDMALNPALHGLQLYLVDSDPATLEIMVPLCRKISEVRQAGFSVQGSSDLDAALPGADFVGLTISTGGDKASRLDVEIPARYGIFQTVGDTVGPGGWSRALRNIPVVTDIVRRVEALAPKAWFMNYSNPMTTLTRTIDRVCNLRSMGICHEILGFQLHLAAFFGVDCQWGKDITFRMAGINHLIWLLDLDVRGQNGVELFREWSRNPESFTKIGKLGVPEELILGGGVNPHQTIKIDQLERTGYLPAAGDSHTAEFFPYYLSSEDTMRRWGFDPGKRARTFARGDGREKRRALCQAMLDGSHPIPNIHSHEQADYTIAALAGLGPALLTPLNLPNIGQIDNVPRDAVVESMAYLDATGIQPLAVGELPLPILHALMQHIPNQEMIVEAGLTGNRELAVLALTNDPLIPSPDIAAHIADDIFEAFHDQLPQFNGLWSS